MASRRGASGLIAAMFAVVLVSVASPARAAADCGAEEATRRPCSARPVRRTPSWCRPVCPASWSRPSVLLAPWEVLGVAPPSLCSGDRSSGRHPGQTLYVNVGGDPTHDQQCEPRVACVGGFNGGGSSTFVGGGGGGGSDVRTVSYQRAGSLGPRLIVAGGGGGSGGGTEDFCKPPPGLGGAGGDAGSNGSPGLNVARLRIPPGEMQARPRPVARVDSSAASAGCWGRVA